MISKSFIKSSLIYTLAGTLPMVSSILLLPFYIYYLSAELYGALALYLSFSIFVQILATFSFDSTVYIHYHEYKNDKSKLSGFISSAFIFILFLGAAIALILTVAGALFFEVILSERNINFFPYGIASVGIGIFQAVFKVHNSLLQTSEKPTAFLWSNVLSFSFIASFTIIGLKLFPNTLMGPIMGRLLGSFISAIWVYARIFKSFGYDFNFSWLRSSFSFNVYSFVYQIQLWFTNYFDRFLLMFYLPLSVVGVYDFAVKCLIAIELLLNSLHNSIYPRIIKRLTSQTERGSSVEVNRYYYGLISVVMLLICLSVFFIPVCLVFFAKDSEYIQSIEYLPYLALTYIFKAIRLYFAVPFNIYKYMKKLTAINFVASATKILLILAVVERWEVYGVIFSAFIASLLEIILLWYYLKDHYKINMNTFKLIGAPLLLIITILAIEPYANGNQLIIHFAYGVLCFVLLVAAYRKELKIFIAFKD